MKPIQVQVSAFSNATLEAVGLHAEGILGADDGKVITTLSIGQGTDGAVFNPASMEVFSSQGDGTLTVVKREQPDDCFGRTNASDDA